MTRAILAMLLTGCAFTMSHPGPGLQGAIECHDGSELVAVDVLGGLTMAVPLAFGIAVTTTSATCGNNCGLFEGGGATPIYGFITAALLAIDVAYFAGAAHGSRMVEECKKAKAQYMPSPVKP
jgi:hypothetical protein